jgi:hypothetical protein
MWRTIMGNIYVTKAEAEQIRRQKEMEQKKRINEAKAKQIAKEKSKLVEERMKQIEEIEQGLPVADAKDSEPDKKLSPEEEKQVKDVLQAIVTALDTAWDAKLYPDREYVMQNVKTGNVRRPVRDVYEKAFSKGNTIFPNKIKNEQI